MLKKIAVEHLRVGMFVHEFCGSWIDHPFWRSSFKLEDPKILQQIRESDVKEVLIDISKGLDVEGESVPAVAIEQPPPAPEAKPVAAP